MHVDQTNVDVIVPGDISSAAVNLVTSPSSGNLTNGQFATNHSNMQIGTAQKVENLIFSNKNLETSLFIQFFDHI